MGEQRQFEAIIHGPNGYRSRVVNDVHPDDTVQETFTRLFRERMPGYWIALHEVGPVSPEGGPDSE